LDLSLVEPLYGPHLTNINKLKVATVKMACTPRKN
jgi:hypothetical protein